MRRFPRAVLLAGAVWLLLAPLAFAQALTDAEFKCQSSVNKAGAKFVKNKWKCISKCLSNFWKGAGPSGDCYPPYAGMTLSPCITDPAFRKGAEEKFEDAIRKACDPTFKAGTDCPECYTFGDCTQEAADRVANIESQIDSFVPGVACETGADALEQKCMLNTSKVLVKQVASVTKCYAKCETNARKGLISQASCDPPASDPATATCVSNADAKCIAGVNKKCGDVGAIPDCGVPDDDSYPNGTSWCNLGDVQITGNVPGTYCVDTPPPPTCGAGIVVGGFCWYLGAPGASCDTTCAADGKVYDPATKSYAGSDGTDANCVAVYTALGGPNTFVTTFNSGGVGCADYFGGGALRDLDPTTSTATIGLGRVCACQ